MTYPTYLPAPVECTECEGTGVEETLDYSCVCVYCGGDGVVSRAQAASAGRKALDVGWQSVFRTVAKFDDVPF